MIDGSIFKTLSLCVIIISIIVITLITPSVNFGKT